ncbi:ABC transporter ATP-binding protein [Pontibacterium granulatum]|uniref:ABC transporter ATP-binding protein n=1 Tax=Pontibacterium granulatum TaxID=2036029 RepID=UPI002499F231|nr:ABC transporter ATP-binding protein [Pontibacterium granulatum]MDI3323865.1 ABC transporter ATP-binding protein [Pontibacterium granulatum]
MQPLLEMRNLQVGFATELGPVPVVRGVDLQIGRGEIVGLVGESGSGKSVTCMAAMGLLDDNARLQGEIRWQGKRLATQNDKAMSVLRGSELAMIFQDPMSTLNPVQTIGKQLYEAICINHPERMSRRKLQTRALDLLRDVGVPAPEQRLKAYPHQLSGGLNQRVVIAMMLAGNPSLLIADEPTTALDVTVQAQIIELLQELRSKRGMSIILVTHDLGVVAETCDRVVVMYCGEIVEHGPVSKVFSNPRHPYTHGLLASLPRIDSSDTNLEPIPGVVPHPDQLSEGCAFAPRCPHAAACCYSGSPMMQCSDSEHLFACFSPFPVNAESRQAHAS